MREFRDIDCPYPFLRHSSKRNLSICLQSMMTVCVFTLWLLDFLRYCLHLIRPKWKLGLLVSICLLLSLIRVKWRRSALKFASEPVKLSDEVAGNRGKFKALQEEIRRKVVSVDYIQHFVGILASQVRETLSEQYQTHVKERRALLRTDFQAYQDCVSAWIHHLDRAIDSQAQAIAQQDSVEWSRLEPALGKFMQFSRFKVAVPVLRLALRPSAYMRKLSWSSCEEIMDFAGRLRKQTFPLRETLPGPLRAKVIEAVVEDEVWLTFNTELREAAEVLGTKEAFCPQFTT